MTGIYHVTSPVADVHGVADLNATRGKFETQLVFGEAFEVVAEENGWCKGMCEHDSYAGWVERKHLSPTPQNLTHVVTALTSHMYKDATIKAPLVRTIGFGSLIGVTKSDNGFAQLSDGSWIYEKHIAALPAFDTDIVSNALKFLEVPYYWGGRSSFGIDCSGLVQVVLARAGIPAPRDSGDQEQALGTAVDEAQIGDLVFFPNHVGIMADDTHIVHANAFNMKVTVEPLEEVAARGKGITSIKRL